MKKKKKHLHIYDVIDSEEEKSIEAIYEKDRMFLDKAIEVLKTAHKILPLGGKSINAELSSPLKNTLLGLYVAAFGFFRSIIILCKSGLDLEALVILRSLMETCSYLLYISETDHEERMNRYKYSIGLSYKSAVDKFLTAFPDDSKMLNVKWYKETYDEAILYFKDKHGQEISDKDIKKKCALRPDVAADNIKDKVFLKHYQAFYPHASAISHGQMITDYIKLAEGQNKFLLRANPTNKFTQFCLIQGITFILFSMKSLNELLKLEKDNSLNVLEKELFNFIQENYTKPNLDSIEKRKTRAEEQGRI